MKFKLGSINYLNSSSSSSTRLVSIWIQIFYELSSSSLQIVWLIYATKSIYNDEKPLARSIGGLLKLKFIANVHKKHHFNHSKLLLIIAIPCGWIYLSNYYRSIANSTSSPAIYFPPSRWLNIIYYHIKLIYSIYNNININNILLLNYMQRI